MKRLLSAAFALTLLASFTACTPNTPKEPSSSTPSDASQVAETGEIKLGLGVISSIKSSSGAGESNGLAQVDTNVAAVLVGGDGKILNCYLDAVQSKVNFTAAGQLVTDVSVAVKTKTELGAAYDMKKASGIQKEWNEQAAALAAYVKGKTLSDVEGIAVDNAGKPTGSDLKASVTVSISGYIAVIKKAYDSAKAVGTKDGDTLGLGIVTELSDSKPVEGDKDGLAQAYSTYAAVSFSSDGKITGSVLDASQTKVTFSKAGKLTVDPATATFKTKVELGDEYGMKEQSGIKKEWFEQAKSFSDYIQGKTAEEVNGIAVDEKTHPSASDLKASVTVSVGGLKSVVVKAAANKK